MSMIPNPFVVELIQRRGESQRYRVSRKGIGGVYSDEFDHEEKAEFAAHQLAREWDDAEALRYRIWCLERELRWSIDQLRTRFEEPYEEGAPERAEYNKALRVLNGETK